MHTKFKKKKKGVRIPDFVFSYRNILFLYRGSYARYLFWSTTNWATVTVSTVSSCLKEDSRRFWAKSIIQRFWTFVCLKHRHKYPHVYISFKLVTLVIPFSNIYTILYIYKYFFDKTNSDFENPNVGKSAARSGTRCCYLWVVIFPNGRTN